MLDKQNSMNAINKTVDACLVVYQSVLQAGSVAHPLEILSSLGCSSDSLEKIFTQKQTSVPQPLYLFLCETSSLDYTQFDPP